MNPIYQQLIDREQAKISLLQGKITRHEERIATLRELAMEDEEESGSSLQAGNNSSPSPAYVPAGQGERTDDLRYPSRISDAILQLLQYIGTSVRSLDELEAFCIDSNLGMKRKDITSFANVYRKRFGMLDSPALSHYQLTERGRRFVNARVKNATPAQEVASVPSVDVTANDEL